MKKYFVINYREGKNNLIIPVDKVIQLYTFIDDGDFMIHFHTKSNSIDISYDELDCIDIVDLFEV